jgi:(1->4)-alpha-D-glucan 1-alpha-D-glucosylmutase
MSRPPVTATYRLQFHAGFTFADALPLVPYFAALGVSHLYASPVFAARPGSQHGYDMVDPARINPELGGEDGFRRLAGAARAAGLGLILDIVPNHMATHAANAAWMDVLAHGRASRFARTFDIDWEAGPITLPVLGAPLDEVIAGGDISVETDEATGLRMARYYEHAFPLRPDRPEGGRPLAEVLGEQHWRLLPWQEAARGLSYRRFFNIAELIGVRVEDEAVFEAVHRLPLQLLREGLVDGLRIDHVDGLADPEGYCRRLREATGPEALIVVEKILEGEERLRDWPIDGTTGYERLVDINGLFIDADGYRVLDAALVARGLLEGDAHARLARAKRQVLDEMFGGEVARLAAQARDLVGGEAREAVVALLVHCPVYRSYATGRGHGAEDEAIWDSTLAAVAAAEPPAVTEAVRRLVAALKADRAPEFATAFQQLAGPAMAKGLEDTEFYRSLAVASANEVGGDLAVPSVTFDRFHRRAARGVGRRGLVPLATHDTKRGPDTRARLDALSFDAAGFLARFERWREMVQPLRQSPEAPDDLDLWLIVQTLIGALPLTAERLEAYLTKAMREAKRHTRWEVPEAPYEAATLALARAVLDSAEGAVLRSEIDAFVTALEPVARQISLAQTILQLTIPGVPDIYQGTEFWDHSLVDPDNRRPVDWAARRQALEGGARPEPADDGIGLAKFHVIRRLLHLRRTHPGLVLEGSYEPLDLGGPGDWIGFVRRHRQSALLVAVPTRPDRLGEPSSPTGLPAGRWRNAFDGQAFDSGSGGPPLARSWPFLVALDEGSASPAHEG